MSACSSAKLASISSGSWAGPCAVRNPVQSPRPTRDQTRERRNSCGQAVPFPLPLPPALAFVAPLPLPPSGFVVVPPLPGSDVVLVGPALCASVPLPLAAPLPAPAALPLPVAAPPAALVWPGAVGDL